MIGLTSLWTNGLPMVEPKLDRRRALFVLDKIDEILAWEKTKEREEDVRFVDLGQYLCEVRAGQYWRLENLKSFDEFLEKRFPESRRKAYYLMAIHENLTRIPKPRAQGNGLEQGGGDGKGGAPGRERLRLCNLVAQSQGTTERGFQAGGGAAPDGQETEPWELIYFKLYKSQLPVIEQALETAALMLGSDKSRGYCLEMISADFLPAPTSKARTQRPCFLAHRACLRLTPRTHRNDRNYSNKFIAAVS